MKNIPNQDFEAFRRENPFLIKNRETPALVPGELKLGQKFVQTFPILSSLLTRARVWELKFNGELHRLLAWTDKDDLSCGWLTKQENMSSNLPLIEEHQLLLKNMGGIEESFNEPDPSLTNNQTFLFLESKCSRGIGGWDDYYDMVCEDEGKEKIDFHDFICFVQEANGDVTLYDPTNKEVMLFAHDHSFENVEFVEGQPKYTFHTFKGIKSFRDYVEKLAEEWRDNIFGKKV